MKNKGTQVGASCRFFASITDIAFKYTGRECLYCNRDCVAKYPNIAPRRQDDVGGRRFSNASTMSKNQVYNIVKFITFPYSLFLPFFRRCTP